MKGLLPARSDTDLGPLRVKFRVKLDNDLTDLIQENAAEKENITSKSTQENVCLTCFLAEKHAFVAEKHKKIMLQQGAQYAFVVCAAI